MHIGVANCAPFACTITEHTVSLLLRQGDGQIFSYVADIAAQKYSARRIQAASPLSVHHPASKSKTRFVSGLHSSCILLQDSEGALFPPRGLPQIKCASVSQRALPYFDYSQSRPRKCNIVAVVFANSQLHTAVATGDLEMVQTLIAKHGLLYFDDGQNIFHLCAIAAPCKVEKVLHFLLGCKHLQGSLDSLLSARDGNGHVPFVTAIISNNLRIAEILLAKVDLLEPQRSSSLWGEDDNTLHAKALCAADSLGCTALHHLCAGVGARLDENIPIFRRACYSGDIVVKIKLMDTLLQTTNLGTAQDRFGNTALARLLMSKAPSELAVKLAQNTDVVNCSVAGSSQNPLSSDQLDRLVFCIFTLYHNDGAGQYFCYWHSHVCLLRLLTADAFAAQTTQFWRRWSRHCAQTLSVGIPMQLSCLFSLPCESSVPFAPLVPQSWLILKQPLYVHKLSTAHDRCFTCFLYWQSALLLKRLISLLRLSDWAW